MKVVAIIGGPKGKGDGYAVARAVERRMKSPGEVDYLMGFFMGSMRA